MASATRGSPTKQQLRAVLAHERGGDPDAPDAPDAGRPGIRPPCLSAAPDKLHAAGLARPGRAPHRGPGSSSACFELLGDDQVRLERDGRDRIRGHRVRGDVALEDDLDAAHRDADIAHQHPEPRCGRPSAGHATARSRERFDDCDRLAIKLLERLDQPRDVRDDAHRHRRDPRRLVDCAPGDIAQDAVRRVPRWMVPAPRLTVRTSCRSAHAGRLDGALR